MVEGRVPLNVLMMISAVFVCSGAVVGAVFIKDTSTATSTATVTPNSAATATSLLDSNKKHSAYTTMYHSQLSVLHSQFTLLYTAFQSSSLQAFIVWWICGNATFTVHTFFNIFFLMYSLLTAMQIYAFLEIYF